MEYENGEFTEREKILIESFRLLNSDLELKTVIGNALRIMIERFDGAASCLIIADMRDFSLHYHALRAGGSEEIRSMTLDDGSKVAGWEMRSGRPVVIENLENYGQYAAFSRETVGVDPRAAISAPLYAGGEFIGIVQAIRSKDGDSFEENDLDLLEVVAERIALTLRNAWILEEAVSALEESKSLYEVGKALSSSLEVDDLLDKILDSLGKVVDYNLAVIYLVDPRDKSIYQVSTRGVPESEQGNLHLKIGQGICGRVAETGKSIIVSDVRANSDYIPIRSETMSEMAVPIMVNESMIGVFNVESDRENKYTDHHLELMTAFANLAGLSIERARLHQERLEKRRMENELSIARRIQMTFLPGKDPEIEGMDVAGVNIPSAAVGGDYYDFISIVENQYGIAIGDVSGKGIPASLIMAAFRASLKAEIRNNYAIRTILSKVNSLLYESIERDMFVTAVYGVLDSQNGIFTFSNAGHNPPIIRRASGAVEYLKEGGMALGVFPDSRYRERPISLSAGDILFFYTDGVSEVFNEKGEEFGVDGILDALSDSRTMSSRQTIDHIIKKIRKFSSPERETDDLTMIVVKSLK